MENQLELLRTFDELLAKKNQRASDPATFFATTPHPPDFDATTDTISKWMQDQISANRKVALVTVSGPSLCCLVSHLDLREFSAHKHFFIFMNRVAVPQFLWKEIQSDI